MMSNLIIFAVLIFPNNIHLNEAVARNNLHYITFNRTQHRLYTIIFFINGTKYRANLVKFYKNRPNWLVT
jgi:hypothetical protein